LLEGDDPEVLIGEFEDTCFRLYEVGLRILKNQIHDSRFEKFFIGLKCLNLRCKKETEGHMGLRMITSLVTTISIRVTK
jgi:hypothetical protein